ncbi:membrane protein [Pseudidiomarina salinarum]|uniref:Membrane protein n=1 Tax=Pseudidiomarina salinarum TaxID=435908 RepID=A0A094L6Z2_9GAMM|nr:DUF423 domain-containing protein [Pseudidiomarina salinarum]KFZ30518.1 membrane protein [Pseudidiomarina salinarum]RUO69028.1 DUF423 domain-containing protein [Pseudidiomarina salinarum]
MKLFAMLGALNMAMGVILGAFAAHTLKQQLSADMLAVFQVGVQYQIYHALGLLLVSLLLLYFPNARGLRTGGWILLAGIILFSGSLYLLSLTGISWFGPVTPVGGAAFIIGWLWIAYAVIKA